MGNYFLKILYALLLLASGSTLGFNRASTSAEAKLSTSAEAKCIERERQALVKFKQGLHDASGMLSTWRDDEDCCKWKGIECNNETGYIQKLVLRGHDTQYMRGAVNFTVLTDLQDIEYLDLSYNDFRGSNIPKCIALFSKLRYLNLSDSLVGGSIPYQLGNLSHLEYLDLGGTSLSGAIPLQIGNLRQLRYLDLRGNSFIGPLPFQGLTRIYISNHSYFLRFNWSLTIASSGKFISYLHLHKYNNSKSGCPMSIMSMCKRGFDYHVIVHFD